MRDRSLTLFDLAPGKVVAGRYQILSAHRHGGMSATFLVQDAESNATLELQVFPAALFENTDQARDFSGVLEAWKRIESEAVLAVLDVLVRADGTLLFVTEMPPGTSLRNWLTENKQMSAGEVVALGTRLLAGLEAVHAAGQIHGDIKPHTIHLDATAKSAMLVDGGITSGLWSAKHLGDKTALIGTPFYAPIEQFGGESPDVQSDVYNLATVLFEALTGVVPWPGQSFLEIFQAKLEKRPPTMGSRAPELEVAPELEAAIVGGLIADRKERHANARVFREALEAAELD
ncbi:MAG: serine/threonine-protein kinase [bacterium]|jgi:serine/threonine protein kinase